MMSRLWRRIEGFDLDFRPHSYFWPLGLREHLLATVKGTARRAMLADYGYGQDVENDAVARILAAESVSEPLRRALGRIHPMLMSGEYLPDRERDELEIARVVVASVMGDVTSVRARRTKKGIALRIVDEHETEYEFRPRWVREPLRMRELIRMIENAKPSPTLDVLKMNREGGCSWEELDGFVEVSSPFYPRLGEWYERYLDLWIASRSGRRRERRRVRRPHPGQSSLALVQTAAHPEEPKR